MILKVLNPIIPVFGQTYALKQPLIQTNFKILFLLYKTTIFHVFIRNLLILMKKCLSCCFKKKRVPKLDSQALQTEPEVPESDTKSPQSRHSTQTGFTQQTLSLNFLVSCLHRNYLFRTIPESQIKSQIGEIKLLTVPSNQNIVTQNERGQKYYLIVSGNCDVLIDNTAIAHLSSGQCFGEMALLTNLKRKSTVRSVSKCTLWALDKDTFRNLTKSVQLQNKNFLFAFLQNSPFFSHLSETEKDKIFEISYLARFIQGEKICGEGEPSIFLYILKSGLLRVKVGGKLVNELKDGQIFGESSLVCVDNSARMATVVCAEESDVYMIELQSIINIFGPRYQNVFLKNIIMNTLLKDDHTKFFPQASLVQLIETFKFSHLPTGGVAINSVKELQNSALIVCYGEISSINKSYESLSLIGFKNKNFLKIGTGKFKCTKPTIIAKASLVDVKNAIGVDVDFFIGKVKSILELQAVRIFNKLGLSELEVLLKSGVKKEFQKNEFIFSEHQNDKNLYLVQLGSVGIYEYDNFIFRYDSGSVFGETGMNQDTRVNSAKALNYVECLVFSFEVIESISNETVKKFIEHSIFVESPFDLHEISIFKEYSVGCDRDLYFSQSMKTDKVYFTEVVFKKKITSEDEFRLVVNQKCVLAQLDHPHIPRLLRTLSDSNCVYFFFDLLDFESLSNLMVKRLPESVSKFIFINILSCLDYIHSKGIMHRDVNPENIYIDKNGYAKLVGFKYSKETKRCRTMVENALEYKAKEVILGQFYSKSAEMWSCGVILYKMLTGRLPLGLNSCKSPYEIMQKIGNFEGKFQAKSLIGPEGEVIRRLLDSNPHKRMDVESIVKSFWAKDYKLNEILYENYKDEFKPAIKELDKKERKKKIEPRKKLTEIEKRAPSSFDWDSFF